MAATAPKTIDMEENINDKEVRVISCPCGQKVRMVGQPNPNPTLKQKREIGEWVAEGCRITFMTLGEYKEKNLDFCFDTKDKCPDYTTQE